MLPRFFVAPGAIRPEGSGFRVTIEGDDAHHIRRVLRLRPGDALWVSDGTGKDYKGVIAETGGEGVSVVLEPPIPSPGEPGCRITLFQGLPKGDKMDWVVQKAAEIGITAVVPFAAARSVVTLSEAKAAARVERWTRIARAAAQQAARGRVPEIRPVTTLAAALRTWREEAPGGLLVVPWEEETALGLRALLRQSAPVPGEIGIVIGPEGGLEQEEIAVCASFGGRPCTLGPRILRTETAGTVVAGLILYELGEMGG